jgi:hypothetical protein
MASGQIEGGTMSVDERAIDVADPQSPDRPAASPQIPTSRVTAEVGAGVGKRPRVAILIVNGFDRKGHWGQYSKNESLEYPWIDICLRQIERYSQEWDYEILVFDNSHLESHHDIMLRYKSVRLFPGSWVGRIGRTVDRLPHAFMSGLLERRHPKALDYLVSRTALEVDYLVTLDTDSFPVRADWLDVLIAECESGAALAGVYRDEMAPTVDPFIHVSGLCVRPDDLRGLDVSFGKRVAHDVGQNITQAFLRRGREIAPLRRSNAVNAHFLLGGLYGDVIYHHGAGSRRAKFWTSVDIDADEQIRVQLRDAAFRDIDHLVGVLRGQISNDLSLGAV